MADIVVANSGIWANLPNLEYTEETWAAQRQRQRRWSDVDRSSSRQDLQSSGRGNLIITASVSATLVNIPQTRAAYNASKAAAVHLAKSLAMQLIDCAKVNTVSLGFIETNMLYNQPKERFNKLMDETPGKRMAKTADLEGVFVFLASDAAPYLTGRSDHRWGIYTDMKIRCPLTFRNLSRWG